MNTHNDDPVLDQVLRQWTMTAPLPPRFQDTVWQRIARAESRPEAGLSAWAALRRLVEAVLPRPQFAVAYVAAFLLLGVTGGSVLAQHKSSRVESELGLRYVQSVDPFRTELPRP